MIDLQDTEQLLEYISSAPKSTPSVFFLKLNRRLDFPTATFSERATVLCSEIFIV